MTLQDITDILFSPISILRNNNIPLFDITFYQFWIGLFIVGGLAIPLLKYIFSMNDSNKDRNFKRGKNDA